MYTLRTKEHEHNTLYNEKKGIFLEPERYLYRFFYTI